MTPVLGVQDPHRCRWLVTHRTAAGAGASGTRGRRCASRSSAARATSAVSPRGGAVLASRARTFCTMESTKLRSSALDIRCGMSTTIVSRSR